MHVEEELSVAQAAEKSAPRRQKVIRPVSYSPAIVLRGISELVAYRDLLYTLTIHRINIRYKQSALGLAWAVIQPLALMLVYTIVFSLFTKVPTQGAAYPVFVLAGILPWNFFQTAITTSATGFVTHTNIITKLYFPREILPFSYVLAGVVDLTIGAVILAIVMLWYHIHLTWLALYALPILLIEMCLVSGFSLALSALQVRFRDVGLALPLVFQLWTFASPVVYSLNNVPLRFRGWYIWNPMVGVVENFRRVVVQATAPDRESLLIAIVFAAVLLSGGYLYFKYREATMADII
ncbi:MAG: ABC transporter permease [Acidobacteriaceae bacterium]|nr:ABC transporter permease [Acidobacteriaceae bacterium]